MILKYDGETFAARIRDLCQEARIIFAAACASRFQLAYDDYHEEAKRGDPPTLRRSLESGWQWTQGARGDARQYKSEVDTLLALLPLEEEGCVPPGRWAADAIISVIAMLEEIIQNDGQRAAGIAEYTVDVVENHVRSMWFDEHGEMPSEADEYASPCMQTLLARMERDLSELEATAARDLSATAVQFRRRAESERVID